MLGNYRTGAVIGLTDAGANICKRMFDVDVPISEVTKVDEALAIALQSGCFCRTYNSSSDHKLCSAYLHVTQRCNFHCLGCYSYDKKRNNCQDASFESICHAISELAKGGISALVISGGEPFLRSDLLEITKFARQKCNINSIVILSNGVGISEASLQGFAPYVNAISVSIDAPDKNTMSWIRIDQLFDQQMGAISAIKEAGIPAHIIPTIYSKNCDIEHLNQYVDLSKQIGASISFSLLTCQDDNAASKYVPTSEQLKQMGIDLLNLNQQNDVKVLDMPAGNGGLTIRHSCGAGSKIISVGADGTVYPCHMLHNKEYAMGNLFIEGLEEIMRSPIAKAFLEVDAEGIAGCRSCAYLPFCGGGCQARILYNRHSNMKDPYCSFMMSFYLEYEKRINAMFCNERR
ncbi:MAG: radical SAM protein [Olsenella sp.]|nr:radical SAM protein [Olsenella sp.]